MRSFATALVVAMAACGAQRGGGVAPPRCAPPIPVPDGFHVIERHADPYPDRIATRTSAADDAGRLLHAFAGVPGEIGEGLPAAGEVPLAGGGTARLLGEDRVWLVSWTEPGPCGERAVLGAGFRRRGFLATLRRLGLLA